MTIVALRKVGLHTSRLAIAASIMAAGWSGAVSAQGFGDTLKNILLYGGPNAPPPSPAQPEDVDCPRVTIAEGGAALRAYSGGRTGSPEALRHQISIVDVARQCLGQPDGSILIKVGVEGRALIGPAGSGGQVDAPVRVVIKRGEKILASRGQRIAVAIRPGEMQGSFVAVEDRIIVPPATSDFDIEVSLGGQPTPERPVRRTRR